MTSRLLSAGVVVVRRRYNEWSYLLLRAYDYWGFPKGLLEAGESSLEAARREVWEETNLASLQFYWGHEYFQTEPNDRGKVARYYLAESPDGEVELRVSPELGRPEHEEFVWADSAHARELLSERVLPALHWAEKMLTVADASGGIQR